MARELSKNAQMITNSSSEPAPTNAHCMTEMGQTKCMASPSNRTSANAAAENLFHIQPEYSRVLGAPSRRRGF